MSVGLVTVAVLVWLVFVEAGTVNFAVTVAEPPAAIAPRLQVKLGEPLQVPCDGVGAPVGVRPAGHASATFTETASEGPPLVTVIVYVCTVAAPAVTFDSPSLLVIETSAFACTVMFTGPLELLPPLGSDVPSDATDAVLLSNVPSATEDATTT